MVAIENMVENIRYKSQILARTNKIESAVTATGIDRVCMRAAPCTDPDRGAGIIC